MKKTISIILILTMILSMTVNAKATDTIIIENEVKPEATATPTPTPTPEATATPTPTPTPEATATPTPTAAPTAGATADTAIHSGTAVTVTSNKTYLALGADLTQNQKSTVLALLGIAEADLPNYDVVYVANAEQHQRLDTVDSP